MAMTIVTRGTSYWTARRLRRYPVQPDAGSNHAPHTRGQISQPDFGQQRKPPTLAGGGQSLWGQRLLERATTRATNCCWAGVRWSGGVVTNANWQAASWLVARSVATRTSRCAGVSPLLDEPSVRRAHAWFWSVAPARSPRRTSDDFLEAMRRFQTVCPAFAEPIAGSEKKSPQTMRIPSQPAGSVLAVYALATTSPISLRISASLSEAMAGAEGRKSSHACFALALELDAVASARSVTLTVSNTDIVVSLVVVPAGVRVTPRLWGRPETVLGRAQPPMSTQLRNSPILQLNRLHRKAAQPTSEL